MNWLRRLLLRRLTNQLVKDWHSAHCDYLLAEEFDEKAHYEGKCDGIAECLMLISPEDVPEKVASHYSLEFFEEEMEPEMALSWTD